MNEIRTKKRIYGIGQRHEYVYWLVQSDDDLASRAARVAALTEQYQLTPDERRGLTQLLLNLDGRRAAKAAAQPAAQNDPPTTRQMEFLRSVGYHRQVTTRRRASRLIARYRELTQEWEDAQERSSAEAHAVEGLLEMEGFGK